MFIMVHVDRGRMLLEDHPPVDRVSLRGLFHKWGTPAPQDESRQGNRCMSCIHHAYVAAGLLAYRKQLFVSSYSVCMHVQYVLRYYMHVNTYVYTYIRMFVYIHTYGRP